MSNVGVGMEPAGECVPVDMDRITAGVYGGIAGLSLGIPPTAVLLFLSKFGLLATRSVTFKNAIFMWLFSAIAPAAAWAVGGTDYLKGRLVEWNVSERWIDRGYMAMIVHVLAFLVLTASAVPVLSKFLLSHPVAYPAAFTYAFLLISCFAGFLSIISGNESGS